MTVDDTLRSQADYLDALAAAIRGVNGRLDQITRTDLEARLGVGGPLHTGMGGVPPALFGGPGQSPASQTLGNVLPFGGRTNVLFNPTWEGWEFAGVNAGTADTRINAAWRCKYVLNSGVVPTTRKWRRWFVRSRSPFNSDWIATEISGFGANACDLDLYLYPVSGFDPGSTLQEALPFLSAAVSYSHQASTGDAVVAISLQILRGATVEVESPVLDPSTLAIGEIRRLTVATSQLTQAVFWANTWTWRLRVRVVKPATSTVTLELTFGEPSMSFSYTPDPLPFTPLLGSWKETRLLAETGIGVSERILELRRATETFNLWEVDESGGTKWGPGSSAVDARLYRSGTKVLSLDDNVGGPVTLSVRGTRVAVPKATQTLAAGTAIVADHEVVMVDSAGPVTLTAVPTVANGADGQMLAILNVGANNITLQDQGTLAGSNLRLTAAGVTLTPRDSIQLMYSATVGDWVQIGNLVSVL